MVIEVIIIINKKIFILSRTIYKYYSTMKCTNKKTTHNCLKSL